MRFLLIWLSVGLVVPYFLGPILIRFRQQWPRRSTWKELSPDRCSPGVVPYFNRGTRALQALGFTPEAYVTQQETPRMETHAVLLTNRAVGDKAMIVTILARGGGRTITTFYVEFTSTYDDGWHFDTLNSATLGAFRRSPRQIKTQVPMLEDPARLYELHGYVQAKHQPRGYKTVYPEGTALDYLTGVMTRSFDEQVQAGLFYVDAKTDSYRPTWKGACLLTWGLLFPVKTLRTLRLNSNGWAVVREFERARGGAWARPPAP